MLYYNQNCKALLYLVVMKTRTRLKIERQRRKWSQQLLAENVGVTKQMISMIERSKCDPSLELANRLEDLFEIPQRELLAEHE